jgi:uncharacterized protein (DUF427 family)
MHFPQWGAILCWLSEGHVNIGVTPLTNPGPGYRSHPDHSITVDSYASVVMIRTGDMTIADTHEALQLWEINYPPVFYLPKRHVRMDLLIPTERTTYCPFKGTAQYWSIRLGQVVIENAVWGYADPYDEVLAIKDHVAFYSDKVEIVV